MRFSILSPFALFLFVPYHSYAQYFKTITPPEHIKTVKLIKWADNSFTPIVEKGDSLVLSFDDLTGALKDYRYTIVRYTHDWRESNLFQSEYLSGLRTAYIQARGQSQQTQVNYQHYKVVFPNSEMRIRLSGNYGIRVFLQDIDKPIIERRFCVYEEGSDIELNAGQRTTGNALTQQQLSAKAVVKPYLDLSRNSRQVYAYAFQNSNWNTLKGAINPRFIHQNTLDYSLSKKLRFPGGSEFRSFDTKSLISGGISISKLRDIDGIAHTYLKADIPRNGRAYSFFGDIDGAFVIRNVERLDEYNAARNADYTWVHFSLNTFNPLLKKDIYVVGAFSDWQLTRENKMHFNRAARRYESAILLKQGFYNYAYAIRDRVSGVVRYAAVDGSHWQTENEYHFLLYIRLWNERFDRLIGTAHANSVNR